jgi:hypothetical protein
MPINFDFFSAKNTVFSTGFVELKHHMVDLQPEYQSLDGRVVILIADLP